MAYVKTTFINNSAPAINEAELNKIGVGIENAAEIADNNTIEIASVNSDLQTTKGRVTTNEAEIASLASGEVPKGAFTPTGGAEYPTAGTGWSYYISNVSENGYTFTGGTLVGKVGQNMDKMLYTSAGWSLIQNNLTVSIPNGAIGNINNPLLDLPLNNSLALKQGVGSVTFTRASTATYINRYGVLKTAAVDEARFEKEGLLIEGASTNNFVYSQAFDNAYWIKTNATITGTLTTAPDGTNTGQRFEADTSNDWHFLGRGWTFVATQSYSKSFFLKAGSCTRVQVTAGNPATFPASAFFDLASGTVGTVSYGSAKMEALADGWYRCSISGTALANAATNINIFLSENNSENIIFQPAAGFGCWVWGAQSEELPFATSYIPTTTVEVTRLSDFANYQFSGNMPNVEDGGIISVVLDFDTGVTTAQTEWIYGMYLATDNAIGIGIPTTQRLSSTVRNANGTFDAISAETIASGSSHRVAQTVQSGSNKVFLDGVLKSTNSGTWESMTKTGNSQTLVRLGGYNPTATGNQLYGHLRNFRVFDRVLTDEEIAIA